MGKDTPFKSQDTGLHFSFLPSFTQYTCCEQEPCSSARGGTARERRLLSGAYEGVGGGERKEGMMHSSEGHHLRQGQKRSSEASL